MRAVSALGTYRAPTHRPSFLRSGAAACLALLAVLVAAGPATASRPGGPRLIAGAPRAASATARPGGSLEVRVGIHNGGRGRSRATRVTLLLSRDARRSGDDVVLGAKARLKALKPRARAVLAISASLPAGVGPGTYRLLACVPATPGRRKGKLACRAGAQSLQVARAGGTTPPAGGPPAAGAPGPASGPSPITGGPAPSVGPSGGAPSTTSSPPPGPTPTPTPAPPGGDANPPTPLSRTTATSTYDATAFLFSGPNPPQQGVAANTIDPARVVVLRGTVQGVNGAGLPGVEVTVVGHPELGHTTTRADGGYDLAANGGAALVLAFTRDGSIPAQRTVQTPWQDYVVVEPVTLVPYDPQVTTIDPGAAAPFQVARGSTSTDADGTRRATLLFPKGITGTMTLPDGSHRPVTSWAVRATEFTVGDGGARAMPGTLPPTTAYTYAAEFSLDQAIATGATRVDFDKPVIDYTEDFIKAPVGSQVPTGSYDRTEGRWVGSANGVVLQIVSVTNGKANLDVDASPGADSAAQLAALGITDDERAQLAALYAPGQKLMRVPLPHFSPWDHNFPAGPPPGAKPPQPDLKKDPPDAKCPQKGSIIGCEDGSLGERIPVDGTPFSLGYSTTRQEGFKPESELPISVTPADLSLDKLKGVELDVDVAGRRIVQKRWCNPADPPPSGCGSTPALTAGIDYTATWDHRDAYGREVLGRVEATVRVIYVYDFQYYSTSSEFDDAWATLPDDAETYDGRYSCGNASGPYFTDFFCGVSVGRTVRRPIGAWGAGSDGLGGWTLDAHHGYDPDEHVVHTGSGAAFSGADTLGNASVLVGGGGDGTPSATPVDAKSVDLDYLLRLAAGPDGSLYALGELDGTHGHHGGGVRRITRDGKVVQFAGNGTKGQPDGDGGPAVDATLGVESNAIATGPDGSVYLAVTGQRGEDGYIRRIDPQGRISTIAGDGDATVCLAADQPCDDDVPARSSRLYAPSALTVGPDGAVYFAELDGPQNGNQVRVRRIDPGTHRVRTVAGGGTDQTDSGEPGREARLDRVSALALGDDGSLFIALQTAHKVDRIGMDGRLTRFAGAPPNDPSQTIRYGSNALSTGIDSPVALATQRDGSLLIEVEAVSGESENRILRVAPDGALEPVAGRAADDGQYLCNAYDRDAKIPAQQACIDGNSAGIATTGDGNVSYTNGRYEVRTIRSVDPGFQAGDSLVPSPDGRQAYVFDGSGRHLRTLDGQTGAVQLRFAYDAAGRLTSVTDAGGDVTTVERGADGRPTAIVAPGGQRTVLGLDGDGMLATVADPAGNTHHLAYGAGGLLTGFTDPDGGASKLTYDAAGRLVKDEGPDGEVKTLARTEHANGASVAVTTKLGRTTRYAYAAGDDGGVTRTVTDPAGAVAESVTDPGGTNVLTDPDGTVTTTTDAADPRWGAGVPYVRHQTVATPGGHAATIEGERFATLSDPADPLTLTHSIERSTTNGHQTEREYDGATRSLTTTSPEGRRSRVTFDALGRPTAVTDDLDASPDLAPATLAYDGHGRLAKTAQGDRSLTYDYDAQGELTGVTDAAGHHTGLTRDAAGWVTAMTAPGGGVTHFTRNHLGDVTSLTTPTGRVHTIGVDPVGRIDRYTAPGASSAATAAYDSDGAPASLTLAGGRKLDLTTDAGGRLTKLATPDADTTTTYMGATDRPATAARKPAGGTAQETDTTWDAFLPTAQEGKGPVAWTAAYAYDDDFDRTSAALTVGSSTFTRALTSDQDGLTTADGPLTFTRSGAAGRTSDVGDGTLHTGHGFDDSGRPASSATTVNGQAVYANALTRDKAGRITRRVETVGASTHTYDDVYDADGRLTDVKEGATVLEHYAYDADGERTSAKVGSAPAQSATYDAQGRQSTLGATALSFDADGRLAQKGTATFDYGTQGELLGAVAGGHTITYALDAQGRRVSRTQDGQTTRYYYANPDSPDQVTLVREPDATLVKLRYDPAGRLVRFDRGSTTYYVATDQVGTPRVVTSAAGAIVRRVDRDAFGNVTATTGTGPLPPLGFAGGLPDATTGLVHFGERDYDPQTGRWTAPDPVLFGGGQVSLYAYAGSDPVGSVDPSGLADNSLNGIGAVAEAVPQALAQTVVSTATGVAQDVINDGALRTETFNAITKEAGKTITERVEARIENAAKSPLKATKASDYEKLLKQNGKDNIPYVEQLMRKVTDLYRRASAALLGCPDPAPNKPDPRSEPLKKYDPNAY